MVGGLPPTWIRAGVLAAMLVALAGCARKPSDEADRQALVTATEAYVRSHAAPGVQFRVAILSVEGNYASARAEPLHGETDPAMVYLRRNAGEWTGVVMGTAIDLEQLASEGFPRRLLGLPETPETPALPAKDQFTRADREAWRAILQWPAEFEDRFRDLAARAPSVDGGLKFFSLGQGRFLVEILINRAAYQDVLAFALCREHASAPGHLLEFATFERRQDGKVVQGADVEIAGLTEFDAASRQLRVLSKARGTGDCGSRVTYRFDGGRPDVVEARAQACADNPDQAAADPSRWPTVDIK